MNETNTPQLPAAVKNQRISWFFYDIPSSSNIPNPSRELRQRAVRINLSCWVVPEEDIPWTLYNNLRAAGANVNVYKFDISETPRLLKEAIAFTKKEIEDTLKRAEESALEAEQRLINNEEENETRDEAHTRYVRHQRQIVKRCEKLLEDITAAYQRFGINANEALSLTDSANVITALNTNMDIKARAYVQATNKLRSVVGDSDAVVITANRSAIPPEILADYMEDHNIDASDLRSAFSRPTAQIVVNQ